MPKKTAPSELLPPTRFPFGFPSSIACAAVDMNPNTYRSLRREEILCLDQDEYRNEDLRAHSVLSSTDIVRMGVLQHMINAGLNLKRYGRAASEAAAKADRDLRPNSDPKNPKRWLAIVMSEGEGPAGPECVIGPAADGEVAGELIRAGGVGFVFNVDQISAQIDNALMDLGAIKIGRLGYLTRT